MVSAKFRRQEDYKAAFAKVEDAGQLSAAMRDAYEIFCIESGSAEYWIEDQYYKVHTGDILLVPAGVMLSATLKSKGCPFGQHSIWISRRFISFLKHQDESADFAFRKAGEKKSYLLRLPKEISEDLIPQFADVVKEHDGIWLNAEISSGALLSALIVKINRLVEEYADTALLQGESNRLSDVLAYIHDHCTEPLAVEQLADKFSYSASHLAHSFKKQMGTSLYHYVLLRRLRIGQTAMLDNVPVKEAYQRCGFGDYAGFYRAFLKEFGMSPQQYKKKNQ